MEQIALGTSGRSTTRLGFGCSSLMGATGRRESLKLLETAYDAGIRHFDVAPMYGYGEAESCLGEFLQHHQGHVTVTTKYGIPPAKHSRLIRVGRRIASPIIQQLPSVKRELAQAVIAATRNTHRPAFTAAQAKASLDRSLTALRTSHIDLWLLHEATAPDLQDDGLLHLLEDLVKQGTIGAFGIGSSVDKTPALLTQRPAYCRVLQYEWSVLDANVQQSQPPFFRIHHRALTGNFRAIHTALIKNKPLLRRWSEGTNTDLSNDEALAQLMLKASLEMNPASIVLFSSKKPGHIRANAETAENTALASTARRLYGLVREERDHLLGVAAQSAT